MTADTAGTDPTGDRAIVTECECHDPAHIMAWSLTTDNKGENPYLAVSVQLNQLCGFRTRFWLAMKYVVGGKSRFTGGHWDSGAIGLASAKELLPMIGEYIVAKEREGSGIYPTTIGSSSVAGGGVGGT